MPPQEDGESTLEHLRSKLYDPKEVKAPVEPRLSERAPIFQRGWKAPAPEAAIPHKEPLPLALKFLIGAFAFFIVAGGLALYFILVGGRAVSTANIDVAVTGPTTIAGGDTVPLQITITNRNPVAIATRNFTVTFPSGTRSGQDVSQSLEHYTDDLGTIPPGGIVTKTVSAVLFGSQNQSITLPIRFEYTTPGSTAVFVKEKDYTFTITTSPVSITATGVSEIASGQPVTFSLAVRSNAPRTLTDLAVTAEYPFGFSVSNISIPSEGNGTLIPIGALSPGQEKRFTVTGTLTGENNEARVFHWNVGSTASSTNGALGVTYTTTESDVALTKPFLDTALTIDDDSSANPVITVGEPTRVLVSWTNTLSSTVLDGEIVVALSGSALDSGSVVVNRGFYQSSDNTVHFNRDTDPNLGSLQAGDTGTGSFTFSTKKGSALAALRSPSVSFSVSVRGRRVSESNVPTALSATVTRTAKVATNLTFTPRVVRTVGTFENSGAWPPVPGSETTYTILLSAGSDLNAVAGAKTSMTLPSYVRFTGVTSPADGSVSYIAETRTVTWNAGDIAAGGSKQAAFQVAFLPSTSQQGTSPTLVSAATLSGTDRFTQTTVSGSANALTIQATSDPAYQMSFGTVQ